MYMRFLMFLLMFGVTVISNGFSATGQEVRASFSNAVEEVSPAVVNIFTKKRVVSRTRNLFFNDPFFQQFMGGPSILRERVEKSLGSGVMMTAEGHILTNLHVIEGAEDIRVVFADRTEQPAIYIGGDKDLDLAVLKLENPPSHIKPAQFMDSDTLQVGDVALAIGNPFGFGQSVSLGIISAVGRGNTQISQFGNFIQTDAAINPGNSGGALVDSTGKVVGINTAIFTKTGTNTGVGFAIPANLAQVILQSIITTGKVERPWFGATGQDLSAPLAERLGLTSPHGVLINELAPNGPAETANIRVGDVIIALDGQKVTDTRSFNARIVSTPRLPNTKVPLTVWRGGENVTLKVQFKSPPAREQSDQCMLSGNHPLTGHVIEQLSPALNIEIGVPLTTEGVAVVETPQRRGFMAVSFKQGDILQQINGTDIHDLQDVEKALSRRARKWKITYTRGERLFRVIIQQ